MTKRYISRVEKVATALNTKPLKDWATKNKEHLIHGAEVAGLGVLGKPSYDALRAKKPKQPSEEDATKRRHAKYEIAGLGILGVPAAIGLARHALHKTGSADMKKYASAMFAQNIRIEELAQAWLEKEAGLLDFARKPPKRLKDIGAHLATAAASAAGKPALGRPFSELPKGLSPTGANRVRAAAQQPIQAMNAPVRRTLQASDFGGGVR
jgi:hypothetical protein